MADLNAVIQFIVKTQRGRGYDGMAAEAVGFTITKVKWSSSPMPM